VFSRLKLILPAVESSASSFISYSASSFVSYKRKIHFVSPYSHCLLYCSLRLPGASQRERAVLTAAVKALSRYPGNLSCIFYSVTVLLKDCGQLLEPLSASVSPFFI